LHPESEITWAIAGTIVVGSALGSILPDIDQPTSDFWDVIPLGEWIGKVTSKSLGGHRNLSHSILGYVLFVWLFSWLSSTFLRTDTIDHVILLQSFEIGLLMHLIADAVTVQGIPLFWPLGNNMGFPPRPFHGVRILTGKWFENLIIFPATTLIFIGILVYTRELLVLF
jgi:membrane-bound metal-dependent hydrolase YbcI (DUF457 family)